MEPLHSEKVLDKSKELMIYRIVQEQLNNITKYACADKALIQLREADGHLFLKVSDNGVGFDPSQLGKRGIGLRNIKSRLEFYCGTLNIISAPGEGCTLEISVPVHAQTG